MRNLIDISHNADDEISLLFNYYDTRAKITESGIVFKTYYGLRQYYVTGGYDQRLLIADDPTEITVLSREHKWCHVPDLRIKLMAALICNLKLNGQKAHKYLVEPNLVT